MMAVKKNKYFSIFPMLIIFFNTSKNILTMPCENTCTYKFLIKLDETHTSNGKNKIAAKKKS